MQKKRWLIISGQTTITPATERLSPICLVKLDYNAQSSSKIYHNFVGTAMV